MQAIFGMEEALFRKAVSALIPRFNSGTDQPSTTFAFDIERAVLGTVEIIVLFPHFIGKNQVYFLRDSLSFIARKM